MIDFCEGAPRLYSTETVKASGSRRTVGALHDRDMSAVIIESVTEVSKNPTPTFLVLLNDKGIVVERLPAFATNEPSSQRYRGLDCFGTQSCVFKELLTFHTLPIPAIEKYQPRNQLIQSFPKYLTTV